MSFDPPLAEKMEGPTAAATVAGYHSDNLRPLNEPSLPRPDNTDVEECMSLDSKAQQSRDGKARLNLSRRGANVPPIMDMGQAELVDVLSTALQRAFGQTDAAVKRVQHATNAQEKAAKKWFGGNNCPNALYLLRMMAMVPEVQAEVRRLCAMESDLDPMLERDVTALWTRVMRMKGAAE